MNVDRAAKMDPGDLANWPESIARLVRAVSLRSQLLVNRKDGSILVRVPAGRFEMGDGEDANCPRHEVDLSEYWIGVSCVTNAQYGRFVKETKHREPNNSRWNDARYARHPVTNVDWEDARAYCKWAGGDLPTEAQWEKAARGPWGLKYPWGDGWDAGKCRNDGKKGNEQTSAVGAYGAGVSVYGTYGQSGNVWEWCRDWYDENYYKQSPGKDPEGPKGGSCRVNRGGSWRNGLAWDFRAAGRGGGPASRYDNLGFRLKLVAPAAAGAARRTV